MNTLEQISIRSPADKNETCAKFVIDDISFPFVFHDVTKAGQKYTLGFYVKSEAAGSLTIFDKVYNTTSEWQKIAITFDSTETNISIFFSTLGTYYLYHTQLEIGNKDTDFERAPEDIEEDIQSVSKKTAELIVDLDAITSRVYSVEQDATSLESRVSTAESKLTKDGLVTTIGSYYTTLGQLNNAIAGLEIGGRNLLTKTKTLDITGVAEKLDETYLGFTVGHYDATSLGTSSYKDVLSGWIPTKEPEAGGQYVLSFYAKGSGQIRTHFYGGSYKTILSENSSNNTNTASDGFSIFNLTSEWKKYWVRYTLESSNTLSTTGNKTVLFRVYGGNEVYVCGVKLEKGNKPTDWSPAPEDAGTIDDIIIGGRNLILQSKDFTTGSKYWSIASPWTTSVDDEGYTVASINVIGNSSTAWYRLIPQNNIPTSECTNGVIVSFDFMCDDLAALDNKCICSLQNYASDGSRIAWYEPTFDTTHARYIPGVYSFSEELENGKWVRVTVKFTYADLTKTHTESIPDYSRLSFNLVQNGSIHIKRCKAEYGNKATDWTPAPEDVDASISHATSIATQTAGKFNWLVTSASSESSLTLTDAMLTAITDQFKVVGPDGSTTIISGGTMNINNIFAQDIVASGSISGVTLHGVYGEIGGWNIDSNCLYSSYTVGGETTTVVMQNVIDNAKFSYAYITLDNCTATITGTSVLARPVETAEANINIRIPLKTGPYTLYIYSGYIAKYSDVEHPNIQWQWTDSNGDLNLATVEVATEADRITGSDGTVKLIKWQIDSIYVPVGSIDAKLLIKHPMPSAKVGETYEFVFQLEQDGVVYDLSPKLSAAGVTVDKFLAVQKEVAGEVTYPFYVTGDGYLYAENALFTGNSAIELVYQSHCSILTSSGLTLMYDSNNNFVMPEKRLTISSSGITSGNGCGISLYETGIINVTGKLTVSGVDISGILKVDGDTTLRFPIGAGTATANPSVQLRKSGSAGSYALSLVYYNESGGTTYYNLINADGSRNFALASHTHSYLPLSGGTLSNTLAVSRSDSSNAQVYVQNSLRTGRLAANNSGLLGIYDDTTRGWMIFSDTSGNTCVRGESYASLRANGYAVVMGVGFTSGTTSFSPRTTSNGKSDATVVLGASGSRWVQVFSKNGSLSTSDIRDKNIYEMDDRYKKLFMKLNSILFTWNDEEDSPVHIGLGAQPTLEAAKECGITPHEIGAINHDFWDDPDDDGRCERYSMSYDEIAMLAIPFVQSHELTLTEHAAKLVNIESQLESLKTELDEAHIEIARLKKLVNVS